jgi:hypothetical protein
MDGTTLMRSPDAILQVRHFGYLAAPRIPAIWHAALSVFPGSLQKILSAS